MTNKSKASSTPSDADALYAGVVTAAFGKRYEVTLSDHNGLENAAPITNINNTLSCVTRGKKTDLACGDQVYVRPTDYREGVIETTQPRSSLLFRSNSMRSKLIAANVDQMIIVTATQPSFYEALLNRCLIAAEVAEIKPLILLNKCDLANEEALNKLAFYPSLGYEVLRLSALQDITPLKMQLAGKSSVLVGQSGMGKSTIINALLPNAAARTQEVSQVLDSGKHTTTAAKLYYLSENSCIIDSPGLQEFGLHHLTQSQLEYAFPEFRAYLGKCKFNNCKHINEPECAITQAHQEEKIVTHRMAAYKELYSHLHSKPF